MLKLIEAAISQNILKNMQGGAEINAMPPHQNLPKYTKLMNYSINWWIVDLFTVCLETFFLHIEVVPIFANLFLPITSGPNQNEK